MAAFEWNVAKNRQNIRKHGIDFDAAKEISDGFVMTRIDDRRDYGEIRRLSLGNMRGTIIMVAHTLRNHRTRIISARLASRKERTQYHGQIR